MPSPVLDNTIRLIPAATELIPITNSEAELLQHHSLEGLSDNDHPQYLLVDCSNGPLTDDLVLLGEFQATEKVITTGVECDEICHPDGDLKIMPDVQGDIILFGDTDVDNAANSKEFMIYRKAAEGDSYFNLYIDSNQKGILYFTKAFEIQSGSSDMYLQSSAAGNIKLFRYSGSGKKRYLTQAGYVTAASDEVEISWQIDDSTDKLLLERENAYLLGFKVDMPLEVTGLLEADAGISLDGNSALAIDIVEHTITGAEVNTATVEISWTTTTYDKIYAITGVWADEGSNYAHPFYATGTDVEYDNNQYIVIAAGSASWAADDSIRLTIVYEK